MWLTYYMRLSMRESFYRFLLVLFKTFLSEAAIAYGGNLRLPREGKDPLMVDL